MRRNRIISKYVKYFLLFLGRKYYDEHRSVGRDPLGRPMLNITRFGRRLRLPSTRQLKHELLLSWLADQTAKEAAKTKVAADVARPEPGTP